uniref:Uncharacterized protein n=1 Tax=Utricularia reniformis TaxID=192314 RepID=A0A1Y0AYW7_9LAMI|nr:hypothetical protein AEK19_MT1108 [Utricularia reniformis]ART30348.1 hypothetical protein AEK19_MT1108 [Utricularia reniformis]
MFWGKSTSVLDFSDLLIKSNRSSTRLFSDTYLAWRSRIYFIVGNSRFSEAKWSTERSLTERGSAGAAPKHYQGFQTFRTRASASE